MASQPEAHAAFAARIWDKSPSEVEMNPLNQVS